MLCFSIVSICFFVVCFPSIYARHEFDSTTCTVERNSPSLASGRTPRLRVNFTIGNRDFADVTLESNPFPFEQMRSKRAALDWMDRHPNGTQLSCYVDPLDRTNVVASVDYSSEFILALTLIALLPGCLWLCAVGVCVSNAPLGLFMLGGVVEEDEGVLLPKLSSPEQDRARRPPGPPVPTPISEMHTVGADLYTDMKYAIVRKKPPVPVWFPMRRDHDRNLNNTAVTFKMRRVYTRRAIIVLLHAHFTEGSHCPFSRLPLEIMAFICQVLQQMVREEEQRELMMLRGVLSRTPSTSSEWDGDSSSSPSASSSYFASSDHDEDFGEV